MLDRRPEPMSVAAFFAWQEAQAERYELVDGVPVRMMAGARNVHDDIVVNLVATLRTQLRGSGCRVFTRDGAIIAGPDQVRRPDVGVACGARDPDRAWAADPRLVIEVMASRVSDDDAFRKLDVYQRTAGIVDVLLIEPNVPAVLLWTRDAAGGWIMGGVDGLDASIRLTSIDLVLPLAAIFDGVIFPERPWEVVAEPASDLKT